MTDSCFTDTKKLKHIKILIVALIAITSILPAIFIELNENDTSLNTYKLFAKVGSLTATVLFTWQFILGFSQGVSYMIKDLIWTINLHKNLGRFACVLIFLHPIFITFYYLEKENKNLLSFAPSSPFDYYVLLGMVTLLIMLVVFITSIPLRRCLSFDRWYNWHLVSYLMLPLAIIHSFPIGSTIQNTPAKTIWYILSGVIIVFYIYRIACRLCLFSRPYKVIETKKVADSTTEITMSPLKKPIIPQLSQFIYIRRGFWKIARPYTVSDYNQQNNNISITAKAFGKTSSDLQHIPIDTIVWIRGPYGIFANNILNCTAPVVMVAGGIGITPFRRVFKTLQHQPKRNFYLFYGNKVQTDIAYEDEFQHSDNIKVIPVISNQPDYAGEKGYITTELIEKHIAAPLQKHQFFICGPAIMTTKLETQLIQKNVPKSQIHHELFSY